MCGWFYRGGRGPRRAGQGGNAAAWPGRTRARVRLGREVGDGPDRRVPPVSRSGREEGRPGRPGRAELGRVTGRAEVKRRKRDEGRAGLSQLGKDRGERKEREKPFWGRKTSKFKEFKFELNLKKIKQCNQHGCTNPK